MKLFILFVIILFTCFFPFVALGIASLAAVIALLAGFGTLMDNIFEGTLRDLFKD